MEPPPKKDDQNPGMKSFFISYFFFFFLCYKKKCYFSQPFLQSFFREGGLGSRYFLFKTRGVKSKAYRHLLDVGTCHFDYWEGERGKGGEYFLMGEKERKIFF